MSDILLLDLGNSRLKWAVYASTDIHQPAIQSGAINISDITPSYLQDQWQNLASVSAAYMSAVGQQAIQHYVADAVKAQYHLTLQTIHVTAQKAGVENSYRTPENLGVDRWMGLLAAHKLTDKAAIVISCGTATTVDVINAQGQHQGGYIVPGIALMHQSLGAATADKNIHDVKEKGLQIELGQSTHAGIANGIVQTQVALIEKVYAEHSQNPVELYITGGGAEYITPFLSVPYQLELALVFKGMQVHIAAQ